MWITNLISILFVSFCAKHIVVNGASLRCYFSNFETYSVYSLDDPTGYLTSPYYNRNACTIFLAPGFEHKPKGKAVQTIMEAGLAISMNSCLLEWEAEASSGDIGDIALPRAARNAKRIGEKFCETIQKLVAAGLNLSSTKFIGFSLGAPLFGYTGRKCKELKIILPIIFGLDPIRALHGDGILSFPQLCSSAAALVVNIHTNPGRIGTSQTCADIDVMVNCDDPVQPWCHDASGSTGGSTFRSQEDMCSHDFSYVMFGKVMQDNQLMIARSANSCERWTNQGPTINLGIHIDTEVRGKVFLRTSAVSPYGLGAAGANPN